MTTRQHERVDGFTLIELLIVIVVLGILATIVVFAVQGIRDDGQESACKGDARSLAVAVEAYFALAPSSAIPATGIGAERYEQTLVEAGYIRSKSAYWDVSAEGYVINVTPC